MKKIFPISLFVTILCSTNIHAANFALITTPPAILNIFSFLVAGGCLFGCFKIYELVRGGFLSKGWKIFILGFSSFIISQLIFLLNLFEIVLLPDYLVPTFVLLSIGLFLYGIFELRKVLS